MWLLSSLIIKLPNEKTPLTGFTKFWHSARHSSAATSWDLDETPEDDICVHRKKDPRTQYPINSAASMPYSEVVGELDSRAFSPIINEPVYINLEYWKILYEWWAGLHIPSNHDLRNVATQEWCEGDIKICYASRVRSKGTSQLISSRFVIIPKEFSYTPGLYRQDNYSWVFRRCFFNGQFIIDVPPNLWYFISHDQHWGNPNT